VRRRFRVPNLIAASAAIEGMAGWEAHCTAEFLDLKHPEHGLPALPRNQTETVKRRESSEWPIDRLPSASTIRTVVNDQEWHAFSEAAIARSARCNVAPRGCPSKAGWKAMALQTYRVARWS